MGDREDLVELRRIDELESKANQGISESATNRPWEQSPLYKTDKPWAQTPSFSSGIVQGLLIDPLTAAAKLGTAGLLKAGAIDQKTAQEFARKQQQYQQEFNQTASPSSVGRFVGQTAIPAGKATNVVKTMGQGLLFGAGQAAGEENPTDEDYFSKVLGTGATTAITAPIFGGIVNAGAGLFSRLIKKGYDFAGKTTPDVIQALHNPKGDVINKAIEGKSEELVNALAKNKPSISGYKPTVTEAAADLGLTRLGGLEKKVSEHETATTAWGARAREQVKTIRDAVATIAKTPFDANARKAAVNIRASESRPYYKDFEKKIVDSTPELEEFLATPIGQAAKARAKSVMKNKLGKKTPTQIGENIPEHLEPTGILDAQGNMIMRTIPAEIPKYSGAYLDAIGKGMAGEIKEKAVKGLDPHEKALMVDVRNKYQEYLEAAHPDTYGQARELFRENSTPINRMDVGETLWKALAPAEGGLSHAGFASAIREAPRTLKRSFGDSRFDIDDLTKVGFTPEELKVIYGSAEILQKRDLAAQLKTLGSTGKNPLTPDKGFMPHLLSWVAALSNQIKDWSQNRISDKVAKELAVEMLYPTKFAGSVAQAAKSKVIQEKVKQGVRAGAARINALGPTDRGGNALTDEKGQTLNYDTYTRITDK
jgi:hypothetical protein